MLDDFDIVVMSDGLFDEILKDYSAHNAFNTLEGDRFIIGGLKFLRVQGGNGRGALDQVNLNQLKGDEGHRLACLDDVYSHLRDCINRGVRAIWLNREGCFAPEDVPAHDADILSIEDFLKDNKLFQKPSLRQCDAWWDEWDLPDNIRRHSQTVAWGAYVLAVMMRNRGIQVDPILTHRGGLLHDIDKIKTLDKAGQHGQMGAEFLLREGYPAAAEIVREHIMHRIMHPGAEDLPWEVKLVYLVDKLVEGDQIVPFDRRLAALKERYPGYRKAMARAESHIWAMSEVIISILSIPDHGKLISTLRQLQYN